MGMGVGVSMTDNKKYIRHIFWLFVGLFLIMSGYFLLFVIVTGPSERNNTHNPRVRMVREGVYRGEIVDRHNRVLVTNAGDGRHYLFGEVFAHVIGHVGVGQAGVEERYHFNLTNLSQEVWQRGMHIAMERPMQGDSVTLTLDSRLQQHAFDTLGSRAGSVVMIQPSTGHVLAMVSYPTYDPNQVVSDWGTISARTDSPLLNRATQGLYAPGSTFKTLTASVAFSHGLADFEHHCVGDITIDGETIRCFNQTAHGHLDMTQAFAVSCNTFFVALAHELGTEVLLNEFSRYFEPVAFSLAHNQSQLGLTADSDIAELMQASIGQGRTLMTPLHLTLLTAAIANDGLLMSPRVVQDTTLLGATISWLGQVTELSAQRVFPNEQAEHLAELMAQVVSTGTGTNASLPNHTVAGKTGTAENNAGASHGWFTGFVADQDIAITVMLEHSGGTAPVLPMVRNLLDFYLNTLD